MNGSLPFRPGMDAVPVSTVRVLSALMSMSCEAASTAEASICTLASALAMATVMYGSRATSSLQLVGSRPRAPTSEDRAVWLPASPRVLMTEAQVSASVQPLSLLSLSKSSFSAPLLNRLPSSVLEIIASLLACRVMSLAVMLPATSMVPLASA